MRKSKTGLIAVLLLVVSLGLLTFGVSRLKKRNTRPVAMTSVKALKSPDERLELEFLLAEDGTPMYTLFKDGEAIVQPSRLGFQLRGTLKASVIKYDGDEVLKEDERPENSFHDGFVVEDVHASTFDETWEPVWGEEAQIRNHYNEMTVDLLQKATGRKMSVCFRLYDDGLGFRYLFPYQKNLSYFVIKEELTEFAMAGDHTAWWIPGDFDTQEYEYTECRLTEIGDRFEEALCGNSSQTPFSKNGVQTALIMKTDAGKYITLHEAELVNYPCMHLLLDPETLIFRSFLTPDAQGWKGQVQTPCHTP